MYSMIRKTVLSNYKFNLISSVASKNAINLESLKIRTVLSMEVTYNYSEDSSSALKNQEATWSNGTVDMISKTSIPLV